MRRRSPLPLILLSLFLAGITIPTQLSFWSWVMTGQVVAAPSTPSPLPSSTVAPVPTTPPRGIPPTAVPPPPDPGTPLPQPTIPMPIPSTTPLPPPVSSLLAYDGGPVLGGQVTVNLLFWRPLGSHFEDDPSQDSHYEATLSAFVHALSGSPWLQTLSQYSAWQGKPVAGGPITAQIQLGAVLVDQTPFPHSGTVEDPLHDADLQAEIAHVVQQHHWTVDSHSVVVVATPKDIQSCQAGSCTFGSGSSGFCAYHLALPFDDGSFSLPYVNLPDIGCGVAVLPHDDPTTDSATAGLAHELAETITDPLGDAGSPAWGTAEGAEIADICERRPETNVLLLDQAFALPSLWSNGSGRCVDRP